MPNKKNVSFWRIENLRRFVQIACFLFFVYLFLATVGKFNIQKMELELATKAPIDTFFRIDPLLAITTMLASREILYIMLIFSLPIVILTILAGRFFCGWICPLGTTIDASDRLLFKDKLKSKKSLDTKKQKNIKYYILIAVIISSVFTLQIAYLLDPFVILTRAFTFSIFPVVQAISMQLKGTALAGIPNSIYFPQDVQYFFRLNFLAFIFLVGVLSLGMLSRRYWCRNICPLGALLAFLSKFSIIRRQVTNTCTSCAKCVPECKTGAISQDNPEVYDGRECIYCYSCTHSCPALSTSIAPSTKKEQFNTDINIQRRRLIQAAGIGTAIAVLGKTNLAAKVDREGKKLSSELLIRPPGADVEDEFVNKCIRCTECMKVCPSNGLQPSLVEAGVAGLWTPILMPRIGECVKNCNLCSKVCPTQAILPVDLNEKHYIFIGRAVIDRSQCIAWNSDKVCLVCDEFCSYNAIFWETIDGVKRPFIDDNRCVGCGICEKACPIQPLAAIRVFSFGDKRNLTREQQKRFYENSPLHERDGFKF